MTQTELNVATTCITALASQPNSDEKIKLLLLNLFDSYSESEKRTKTEGRSASVSITFTKSEVSKIAKTFKTEFIANGLAAHVLKRQNSKNSVIYEIRYRRGGYYIHVSAATLEKAKAAFLRETLSENIDKHRRKNNPAKNSFTAVAREWLEFKKDKLHIHTYKNYESYCNRFLFPALGNVPIAEIKTIDIHKILPESGCRLYEDLRIVLNSIFKYALACGFISHNPMLPIPFKKAERVNRRPLSSDELHRLIQRLNEPEFASYKQFFFILLFFGLRPCELADARFEGNFLVARNAKRKNGKIEYKKIPVCPQAKELLDFSTPFSCSYTTNSLNRIFKKIMADPTITQYSLRHTFATVCQQYVRPDIVDIWMGDSSERLVGRVYTHFPDNFMYEQMQKVVFDI